MDASNLRSRLLAILAADAAGYSRLMSLDDRATVVALDEARAAFRVHIAANGGRLVDTAGDSVLAVFDSAAGALMTALSVQRELAASVGHLLEDRRLRFRIGLHIGDVIEKPDGTVYGDGVNIAARLQALAEPGGIIVSQAIHDATRGRVKASFADIGEQVVKNIALPVRAYRLDPGMRSNAARNSLPSAQTRMSILLGRLKRPRVAVALVILSGAMIATAVHYVSALQPANAVLVPVTPSSQSGASSLSIAVLPFSNLTGNATESNLADALTTSVASALTRIPGASVVNPASAFSTKERADSPRQTGAELGVRFVLTGSIQRDGSRRRITAHLTETGSNELLWSDEYADDNGDRFSLQDRVTRRIVNSVDREMAMRAMRAHEAKDSKQSVSNLLAQGNAFDHMKITSSNCEKVESLYRQVLVLDPDNVRAKALLAEWLSIHASTFWRQMRTEEREKMLDEASSLATQASAFDPNSWQVNATLGNIALTRGDWEGARRAWETNVVNRPQALQSFEGLANVYVLRGEPLRAIEVLNRALALRQTNSREGTWSTLAVAQLMLGNNDAAIKSALNARATNPMNGDPYLAMAYALKGDRVKASAAAAEVLSIDPKFRSSSWLQQVPPEVAMPSTYIDYERRVLKPALRLAGLPE